MVRRDRTRVNFIQRLQVYFTSVAVISVQKQQLHLQISLVEVLSN